ncbi:YopX family protein [Streptococcus suis]|nr:YopX family protein [Streptococcus suis]
MVVPKFRAWDTFHNKWVKHFYITENGLIHNMEQPHRDLIGAVPIEKSGLVVMQSTGLVDKNGKEIFEGDVVKTTRFFGRADETGGFYEYDKELIGIVKQLEGAWVIDTGNTAVYLWTEIEENEVISNIYENPELMEG